MSQGLHLQATHNQEGVVCPHCSVALRINDPITLCGECRTPYHRECWEKIGGECEHPDLRRHETDNEDDTRRNAGAEARYNKSERPGGETAAASGAFGHLVELFHELHIALRGSLGCALLGFFFLSGSAFGGGSAYVFGAGAAFAGLILGALRWLEATLHEEGPMEEMEKRLLTVAMVANASLFLTGVMVMVFRLIGMPG
jgi:hypothetical protein